jgi:hypothetical protein
MSATTLMPNGSMAFIITSRPPLPKSLFV